MKMPDTSSVYQTFDLQQIFEPPVTNDSIQRFQSGQFERVQWDTSGKEAIVLDRFSDTTGASCSFLRLSSGKARTVRFLAQGIGQLESCPAGGWMLKPSDSTSPSYWIPQAPVLRSFDSNDRILSEVPGSITAIGVSSNVLIVEIETLADMYLDLVVWRFTPEETDFRDSLEHVLILEKQPVFFWTSQTIYQALADIYLYLIHGHVYTNRFIWPRKWKIFSELDAYGLYITLAGLETSTHKKLYSLIKRQLLFSVIARQAPNGGWYQGEWTDLMESHYRFHNGAILLLEAALEERPDDVVSNALEKATSFISRQTDKTDVGLWFLHDSLEDSVEEMNVLREQTNAPWIPSTTLGKSSTNKLILNTHLDTTIVLDRYREITGDNQFSELVHSACTATRAVLALRPAERLYRLVYRLIELTLLPTADAQRLPVVTRLVKRLTWKFLIPRLHSIKRRYPRFVMPGGLIERHLSPLHFNIQYHPVNISDLSRFWRRFPEEDLDSILNEAVKAVSDTSVLKYWSESKPRQYALVVWTDALYRLYTLDQKSQYRRLLAEAIMYIEDAGLGLPPSLLGADPEAVNRTQQIPCPSPADTRLRVANLSCNGHIDIMVINSTSMDLKLKWEKNRNAKLSWFSSNNMPLPKDSSSLTVPQRSWILGREK